VMRERAHLAPEAEAKSVLESRSPDSEDISRLDSAKTHLAISRWHPDRRMNVSASLLDEPRSL
jgi:hypothetical protein